MALLNILRFIRLVVYGILIFFSFVIIVRVHFMEDESSNELETDNTTSPFCLLYYNYTDSMTDSGPESKCFFITPPMTVQVLFLLFRFVTLVLLMCGKCFGDPICDEVLTLFEVFQLIFTVWSVYKLSLDTSIVKSYYTSEAALAGAWISTFLWLVLVLVGIISIYIIHKKDLDCFFKWSFLWNNKWNTCWRPDSK